MRRNDHFGTLATVLDLVAQDLRKRGRICHATPLLRLRDDLLYLPPRYRIERVEQLWAEAADQNFSAQ